MLKKWTKYEIWFDFSEFFMLKFLYYAFLILLWESSSSLSFWVFHPWYGVSTTTYVGRLDVKIKSDNACKTVIVVPAV